MELHAVEGEEEEHGALCAITTYGMAGESVIGAMVNRWENLD